MRNRRMPYRRDPNAEEEKEAVSTEHPNLRIWFDIEGLLAHIRQQNFNGLFIKVDHDALVIRFIAGVLENKIIGAKSCAKNGTRFLLLYFPTREEAVKWKNVLDIKMGSQFSNYHSYLVHKHIDTPFFNKKEHFSYQKNDLLELLEKAEGIEEPPEILTSLRGG